MWLGFANSDVVRKKVTKQNQVGRRGEAARSGVVKETEAKERRSGESGGEGGEAWGHCTTIPN